MERGMKNIARAPRARRSRLVIAQVAVVALVAAGAFALFGVTALADSPNPAATQTGTAVVNGDGSVTVTVTGSWVWDKNDCPTNNTKPGWAVDWRDNDENVVLDPIFVGDANDNLVHTDDVVSCTDDGSSVHGTFAGTLSHTYSADFIAENPDARPCVVTYHVDTNKNPNTGSHSTVAGGTDRNTDNSVEENDSTGPDSCAPVEIAPDVKIVKSGPANGTVGVNFSYTLTATNTGLVSVDDVTITDSLPAGLTFVSAPGCNFAAPVLTCDVGTLDSGESAAVTVTVTPTQAGTVVNTAVVTPDDDTPNDNTSTVSTAVIEPAAQAVAVQPTFTG
jgi:uncharacterized repeat protein (TIGR01451 family)